MNKLREIECFIAVAEQGSFVKAADSLSISKAAISRTVLDLESRLGVRLIHRTTRKLSLTEAGCSYLERCKQIIESLEDADQSISVDASQPTGLLKINAPHVFGMQHLAPLWPRFIKRYPELRLEVSLSDRIVDVVDEGFDLVIRIARLPNSTLIHRQLASTQVLACASPEYLAERGTPEHPLDLANHSVIGYTYAANKDDWHFEGVDGPIVVRTKAHLLANDGETCVQAALAGVGIARQPTFLVADYIKDGRLVELLPDYPIANLGIYAVYPSRTFLPAKVRVAIDFLVEAFQSVNWDDCLCTKSK